MLRFTTRPATFMLLSILVMAFSGAASAFSGRGSIDLYSRTFINDEHVWGDAVSSNAGGSGAIVAGAYRKHPWVARLDGAGNVLWTFVRPGPEFDGEQVYGSNYVSAIANDDGSSYVCGTLAHHIRETAVGLVTHLDAEGHLLGEINIHGDAIKPSQSESVNVGACIRSGQDILVIASSEDATLWSTYLVHDDGSVQHVGENFRSELGPFSVSGDIEHIERLSNGNVVFSLTDNSTTELDEISPDGKHLHQATVAGSLRLVKSADPDEIDLLGFPEPVIDHTLTLVKFNDDVQETSRVKTSGFKNFVAKSSFRNKDGTLTVFGKTYHFYSDPRATVLILDDDLDAIARYEITQDDDSDSGNFNAVGRSGSQDNFIIVRRKANRQLAAVIVNYLRIQH